MTASTYYADGQWNFVCDLCSATRKSSDGVKTWNGLYVCSHHKEKRNPQDFLRGVKDNQTTPWSRSEPELQFVGEGYLQEGPGVLLQETGEPLLAEESDQAEFFFYTIENPGWGTLTTGTELFHQQNLWLYLQYPEPTL